MIHIKYFAKYREWMQMPSEVLDASPRDVGELKNLIRDKHAKALKMLDDPRCIVAINQHVVHSGDGALLNAGDEVAFYPPVTGG